MYIYSRTCIQRPPKGTNKSGLLQQVVFKYRFDKVDLRRVVVSEVWSLNPFTDEKILDWFKLKQIADDILNAFKMKNKCQTG